MVLCGGFLGGGSWNRGLFQRFEVELEAAGQRFGGPTEPTSTASSAPSAAANAHKRGERRRIAASTPRR